MRIAVLAASVLAFAVAPAAVAGSPVNVVACKTTRAVTTPPPKASASLAANVPGYLRSTLVFYAAPPLYVLAPRHWTCSGSVAADGSTSVTVSGSKSTSVTALLPSKGTNGAPSLVCAFFPDAKAKLKSQGLPCDAAPRPHAELRTKLSAHAYGFNDPTVLGANGATVGSPNATNGVVVWLPASGTAAMETCVLPMSDHAECATILDDFLRRWS